MAFNLPPPWDAGFAYPDNVKDEGLERRAFVTKWAPRGTYDNPRVNTGGYAVPKYVTSSGYGQGERVTKWLPRGTQPNVPHYLDRRPQVVSQKSISSRGTDITFALSGTDASKVAAAQQLLAQVATLPREQRAAALKAHLDSVDRTMWGRVCFGAQENKARGMGATKAFTLALAKVMCSDSPQSVPSSGLGRYARSALGAVTVGANQVSQVLTGMTQATSQLAPPAITVAAGSHVAAALAQLCQIGPWLFPLSGGSITVSPTARPDWTAWIIKQVEAAGKHVSAMTGPSFGWAGAVAKTNVTIAGKTVATSILVLQGKQPIAKIIHPTLGEKWAVYFGMSGGSLQLTFRKAEENWFTRAVNWIAELVATVIRIAVELLKNLPGLACGIITNQTALSAAAGSSPQGMAIAAGAYVVGASACAPDAPAPPLVDDTGGFPILPLAIAGGLAAAALLLSKKKA